MAIVIVMLPKLKTNRGEHDQPQGISRGGGGYGRLLFSAARDTSISCRIRKLEAIGRKGTLVPNLAGRVVTQPCAVRRQDDQSRLPGCRTPRLRYRGGRIRQPVLDGQGRRQDLS